MTMFLSGCVGNNGQLPDCHALLPAILEAIAIEFFTLVHLAWFLYVISGLVMWLVVVVFAVLDARYNLLEEGD